MNSPSDIPAQDLLITETLRSHGRWLPNHIAISCGEQKLTYSELDKETDLLASSLISSGLMKGDRVALCSSNRLEHFIVTFGVMKAGGVIAPLSTMLNPQTLIDMITDCDAKFVFADKSWCSKLAAVAASVVCLDSQFAEFYASSNRDYTVPFIQGSDDCSLIYSSGTTGIPKGIRHTHSARAMYGVGFAAEYGISSQSQTLLTTAAYSNGSWMMIIPTLFMGGHLIVKDAFDADEVVNIVEQHQITHAFMVPTQIESLLRTETCSRTSCDSLQALVSAGSQLRTSTKTLALERITENLFDLYGNTEGAGTLLKPWSPRSKLSTVGLPAGGGDIVILSENGTPLPQGQLGEIAGRSAFMSRGYHNRPKENEELFWFGSDGRPYVRTGDIGRLDEEGYLSILDRKKDMIISGGINVFASDIESVLAEHPDIKEVAVVAGPHDKWGETPVAFVVATAPATFKIESFIEWANSQLSKHQRISRVEVRDSFPRNALGKVMKKELRQPLWSAQD